MKPKTKQKKDDTVMVNIPLKRKDAMLFSRLGGFLSDTKEYSRAGIVKAIIEFITTELQKRIDSGDSYESIAQEFKKKYEID